MRKHALSLFPARATDGLETLYRLVDAYSSKWLGVRTPPACNVLSSLSTIFSDNSSTYRTFSGDDLRESRLLPKDIGLGLKMK